MVAIDNINDRNIYADLVRYFVNQGHYITIISPAERRQRIQTGIKREHDHSILRVKTPNIQKTNLIEKAIGTYTIDYLLKSAIKKYISSEVYDLAIYSTPPITLVNTIKYLKGKYKLATYLLLKDIFPQNAVDLNFINKDSMFHRYFKKIEYELYQLSDRIGCMSQANVEYIRTSFPKINPDKVEICPNSIEIQENEIVENSSDEIRKSNGITDGMRVFIYGGNLGKPQGIDFLIKLLKAQCNSKESFFIIIGSGTQYHKLEQWYKQVAPVNIILKPYLPKSKYDEYVQISDIGLVFLDYNFSIPNYPSRLLSYLENKKPILSFTDQISDIGPNSVKRHYGFWSPSNDISLANKTIEKCCSMSSGDLAKMGLVGFNYLKDNYSVEQTYGVIMNAYRQ